MKFNVLESWRGICASGVVLYHISLASHIRHLAPIRNADLGVDFFFVLSGFVLAHAYSHRLSKAGEARVFMLRRMGRLLPLHYFALSLMVLLETVKLILVQRFHVTAGDAPFTGGDSPIALLASVFLVHGLGFLPYFAWNGPSWSISTELWAYVVFLAACLCGRRGYRYGFLLLFVVTGGWLLTLDLNGIELHTYEGKGVLRCLYGFSAGVLAQLVYRLLSSRERAPPAPLEYAVLAGIITVFWGLCPEVAVFGPVVFAVAIVVFAFEAGPVSSVLKTRIPLHLGLVSYSIYLMHGPVLALLKGVARAVHSKLHLHLFTPDAGGELLFSFGSAWTNDLIEIALLLLIVAASTWTYRHIEDPARRYFNALAARMQAPTSHVEMQPASAPAEPVKAGS